MASLIGLIVVVIWAVNFIAAKVGLRSSPLTMASFRVCAASVVLVPFYLCFKQLRLCAFAEAPAARKLGFTRRDIWTFLYLGFFGVSVNQFCFTLGLHYTSVNHSAAMVGMGPIYTLILAVLLRLERAPWHKAVGMAFAFTGIAVLATEGGISARSPSLLGDAMTMTGSIRFATYAVLGKRVSCAYDALTTTAPTTTLHAHWSPFPLALHQAGTPGAQGHWRAVPWQAWAAILYMGLFGSACRVGPLLLAASLP